MNFAYAPVTCVDVLTIQMGLIIGLILTWSLITQHHIWHANVKGLSLTFNSQKTPKYHAPRVSYGIFRVNILGKLACYDGLYWYIMFRMSPFIHLIMIWITPCVLISCTRWWMICLPTIHSYTLGVDTWSTIIQCNVQHRQWPEQHKESDEYWWLVQMYYIWTSANKKYGVSTQVSLLLGAN